MHGGGEKCLQNYDCQIATPEGKRPLGKSRRRCAGNMKMDLKETKCKGVEWIQVAHD
jgi:hypothetical protein